MVKIHPKSTVELLPRRFYMNNCKTNAIQVEVGRDGYYIVEVLPDEYLEDYYKEKKND